MAIANIKAILHCDIEKVWNLMTSLENYSWRSDLSKIEVITAKKLVLRPFVRMYLKKQQATFVADLKEALDLI